MIPDTSFKTGELFGGPQDGAKITGVGEVLPQTLFVGRKWMGDGFAAWSRECCERFPAKYIIDGYHYRFRGYCKT